jgi:hypothetical protein
MKIPADTSLEIQHGIRKAPGRNLLAVEMAPHAYRRAIDFFPGHGRPDTFPGCHFVCHEVTSAARSSRDLTALQPAYILLPFDT